MKFEYEARLLNKALILRGTDILEEAISFKHAQHEQDLILAGSTVHETRSFKHSLLATQEKPYSISYANSLFAGFYQDPGGCAYTYLNGRKSNLKNRDIVGYGLLIDQKSYLQDSNQGLFYIPSLAPLTSLFQRGQYCHPRSRVAVPDKTKVHKIEGLLRTNKEGLIDPADIIVFQDDPIKHEQKFSAFLAKNGRLIHANFAGLEQNSGSKIIASHEKVVKLHQQVQIFGQKTLRRLMRAGSQPIPGFSEIELNEILENGATKTEYAKLQKSLSDLQLKPITKQILQMSNHNLYKIILKNRFKNLLDEVLNMFLKGDVFKDVIDRIIKLCEQEPSLLEININQIYQLLDISMNKTDRLGQENVASTLIKWIKKGLITTDNISELLPIVGSWMINSNENIRQISKPVLNQMMTTIKFNTEQINNLLQMTIDWTTSTDPQQQRAFEYIINELLPYDNNMHSIKQTLNSKQTKLFFPILLQNLETFHATIETLIERNLLTHEMVNKLLQTINEEINTTNLAEYSRLLMYVVAKCTLHIDEVNQTIPLIDKIMDSNNPNIIFFGMTSIKMLAKNKYFTSNHITQIIKWINNSISILNNASPYDKELIEKSTLNIINSLLKQNLLSSNDLSTLLDEHKSFWPEIEKIELQKKLEELKTQESEQTEALLESITSKTSTTKQSMLNFALHGTGAMRTTYPNLMRFNPETNQFKFALPSRKILEEQYKQMNKFNAQHKQKALTSTVSEKELFQNFKIQQQQAQKIDLTDLAAAGSRLKRTIPKIIR